MSGPDLVVVVEEEEDDVPGRVVVSGHRVGRDETAPGRTPMGGRARRVMAFAAPAGSGSGSAVPAWTAQVALAGRAGRAQGLPDVAGRAAPHDRRVEPGVRAAGLTPGLRSGSSSATRSGPASSSEGTARIAGRRPPEPAADGLGRDAHAVGDLVERLPRLNPADRVSPHGGRIRPVGHPGPSPLATGPQPVKPMWRRTGA